MPIGAACPRAAAEQQQGSTDIAGASTAIQRSDKTSRHYEEASTSLDTTRRADNIYEHALTRGGWARGVPQLEADHQARPPGADVFATAGNSQRQARSRSQ